MEEIKRWVFLFTGIAGILSLSPSTVLAIPAWSRKYKVECNACHRPNVPRLNPEGHRFRKMGFRFPDELGEKPDYKEIGDYISVRGRARYRLQDAENAKTINEFEFHDATFFYAGPITSQLSAFFEAEWEDNDDITLNAFGSWFQGTESNYWTVRLGQFHTLSRVGWAGFDRPSVISTTKVLSSRLTSSAIPFTISQDQKGLEFAWGVTPDARLIGQILNGINFAGSGNSGSADDDTDKDFLLAYEHMLDENGSGFTLLAYRGVWHDDPTDTINGVSLQDDPDWNEFTFYRVGATASYLMDIFTSGLSEIQAGVILSRDNVPDNYPTGGTDVNGQAYFLALEQYLDNASVFVRTDFINLDTDTQDWEITCTIGYAHMVNEYLRLAGEIFYTDHKRLSDNTGISGADEPGLLLEAMLNF